MKYEEYKDIIEVLEKIGTKRQILNVKFLYGYYTRHNRGKNL